MAEINATFGPRAQRDRARADAYAAQARADEQLAVVRRVQRALEVGDGRASAELLAVARAAHDERQRAAEDRQGSLDSAEDELIAALDAEDKLFASDNTDPIALLPIRVETIWWEPGTLRVRVYPDDILLSQLDPDLTPAEAAAGNAYWQAPSPDAWRTVLTQLAPARAAWAVRACRPGAPPPVVRPKDHTTPPLRSVAMPKRWRFLGLVDNEVVVDDVGRRVPDPLPIGLLRDEEDGWEIRWFEALKAGMAIELTFPFGVDHLDELLVVGVRDDSAVQGAARLADLLLGHTFAGGLGLLPPGTSTNNTPRTRSGWSSAPGYPGPDPDPPEGERPVADTLAGALGLPEAGFLRASSGMVDAEPSVLAALSLLTWPTLGKGFVEAAVQHLDLGTGGVRVTDPARPWRAIRDHLAEHVRGRGALPMLRIWRQPYGVLPTTALTDWRPDRVRDVDGLLAPWLLRLRERWRAVVDDEVNPLPRVRPGQPVDQIAVEALQRLPVATGLAMRRLDGPGFAIPKTPHDQPPAELGLAGLPPDGMLRWTTPSDGWTDLGWGLDEKTGIPAFVGRLTPDPDDFPARALATADYFGAVRAFLSGQLDAAGFDQAWPVELSFGRETPPRRATFFDPPPAAEESPEGEDPLDDVEPKDASGLFHALLFLPNWAFMEGDDGEDDPLRMALAATGDVDQLVVDVLEDLLTDRERTERVAAATRATAALPRLEQALRALATVPVTRLPELLLEVVDVYAHRLDAWITSLASRRLAELRASGIEGVRYGCYGWVEDLLPPVSPERVGDIVTDEGPDTATVREEDGYILAPSLQHAATAAVLRSGFQGHPGEQAYAVNLNSRRARIARWLLGGVRRGQNLGPLLGYRFERALHDAELDHLVVRFRRQFPLPVVPEPVGEGANPSLWARSAEVVAARNVVDGLALAQAGLGALDRSSVIDGAAVVPSVDHEAVLPLLEDLVDALDAVGDLVLAESVHQLVGGNPIRAGLAADTLGRGEDVPDTFQVLRTPHPARAVTHRLAVLLPADVDGPTGWPTDPVARLQPALEAWTAHLLGPAAGWTLTGVLGKGPDEATFQLTADRLGLGALSTVLEATGAEQVRLPQAVREAVGAPAGTPVTFSGPGWTALLGTGVRIRSLLATAQSVLPSHLAENPGDRELGIAELRTRLATFAADPLIAGHPGAEVLRVRAAEPPGKGGIEGWLTGVRAALAEVLGADVPLLPTLATPAPAGLDDLPGAEVEDWLRRNATVRPQVRSLHETLLLAGARAGRSERLRVSQAPRGEPDHWIGGRFPEAERPPASSHLVWHAPVDAAPDAALTGLLLDEWIELVPGFDQAVPISGETPPAPPGTGARRELTGVAFRYDRPDAKAPHTVLIAVPPDLDRGWTPDSLVQVLRETLELAKLRAVDLTDLGVPDELLPAIRIDSDPDSGTGHALTAIETDRPNTDPAGPFRLEPGHRTSDVESGLAAKVHDPLWLLTRQWQFGEFTAQDAGSPAVVRMTGWSAPIDAWRPTGSADWVAYDPAQGPLDAQVEDEPVQVDEHRRTEGGAALLRMLDDAGLLSAASAALAPHRLPAEENDSSLLGLLDGRVPDAASVAAALDSGTFDAGPDPRIGEVAGRWQSWWADQLAERGPDCFDPHRFEHAVEVSTDGTVLRAEEYLGDGLDWYSVDVHPDPDIVAAPTGPRRAFLDEGLPSLVHYGGLAADRFWEMEDARVDLGAADVSTLDTGRLLLISFATVYGNDWFLVPLEVSTGSLTVLDELLVRDVFDRYHLIERAGREDPSWSMFSLHSTDPDHRAASGLLMMPTERGQVGPPLEQVMLVRDEMANLAWAVQHSYTDGRGELVDRRDQWGRIAPAPISAGELPAYGVQTVVPDYWFPLIPVSVRAGEIRFELTRLTGPGLDARPEGRLIIRGQWLHEEEVPRDGVRMSRHPVLARWFDGSWHSWVRREKAPGSGESFSGLAFDTVRPTEPWPG